MPHCVEQALHAPYGPYLEFWTGFPHDLVSVRGPTHGPEHGSEFKQLRTLVCVPIPHCVEQGLHGPYGPYLAAPIAFPHDLVTLDGPTHGRPPLLGAGLLHERLRVCVPIPHDREHRLHAPYAAQLPSTAHLAFPHGLDSCAGPAHEAPPYSALGFVQARVRM